MTENSHESRDEDRDRALAEANDTTALNGGPARHWFRRGEGESLPTPLRRAKIASALFLWGALLTSVLLLAAELA
jgi:hypothetical protein